MKTKTILLFLCSFILITGCVGKLESYDSLSEEEVINYVKNAIYEELGDEVKIEIVWKHQITLCDANIDASCFGVHKVPNAYTYKLRITSKNYSEISTDYNYFTDSYKEEGNIIERKLDYKSYKEAYSQTNGMNEIVKRLQGIKYEVIGSQILILSTDYDYLHRELFSYLLNYNNNEFSYDIYVIKDERLFNTLLTTTFDYRGVAGIGTNIKNTYGYARDYLEIEKVEDYKYVFFRYSSNGCKGCASGCNCSVIYGVN